MALREIGGDPGGRRGTYFGRRGPWGAHFARSGNNNKTTQGSTGGLTRRWAHGPANFMILTKNISGINAGRSLAHAIAVQDEASRENGRVA